MKKYEISDYIGKTYNRVTITGEVKVEDRAREFTYLCVCGKEGKATPSHIIKGNVKSCGCLHKESSINNLKLALLSPDIGKNHTHGMFGTRPYRIWVGMKTRCDNIKVREYPDYGGRGIKYCDKWKTFEGFWEDMAEGYSDDLTIDRENNDIGYTKENCRWVTMKIQCHNRRKMKGNKSSQYIGVSKRKTQDFYRGSIVDPSGNRLVIEDTSEIDLATWYDNNSEDFYGTRPNNTLREI